MSAGAAQAPSSKSKLNEDDDFNSLLNGDLASMDLDKIIGKAGDIQTEHAPDAIDFEDEDELADEEVSPVNTNNNHNNDVDDFMSNLNDEAKEGNEDDNEDQFDRLFGSRLDDGFGDHSGFDDGETTQLPNSSIQKKDEEKRLLKEQEDLEQLKFQQKLLKFYYPTFKSNEILNMNAIFGPKPKQYEYHTPYHTKPLLPTKFQLEVETDQRRIFKSTLDHNTFNDLKRIIRIDEDAYENNSSIKRHRTELDQDLVLATYEWDYEAIVGDKEIQNDSKVSKPTSEIPNSFEDYDDDSIFEGQLSVKLRLDLNDPNMLFVDEKDGKSKRSKIPSIPTNEGLLLSKFNHSNDKNYDMLKENYHSKIRSTVGNLNIEHSNPASRLQSPYYKVRLTREQVRNFHRQNFKVRPGQVLQFSKLKVRKKKKDRGKEIKEIFAKTTDLTLADSAQTLLMEHTEQTPIVIPNFGMGSKLINYYRKRNEEDISRPKLPVGETHVLGVQDKSPFWNFGFVEPGNIVPTLYNKLVRAPVFRHETPSTDFLLIKSSGGGVSQKFFLKSINHLFVVGQLFPVVDVPGPHSRKVTTASKNRLKMIVYRVLKRSPEQRLLVKDISLHFPDQNDMQNRQRLKEFMEYQRSGDDQGYWKLKEDLPTDRLISPEDLVLLESMQVAQQQMEDQELYTNEEINEELALWNLTKNFINATQGKAMLQINGDQDGKSFSFLKTSMKGGFKSFETNGHSYNVALQQKAYDEEISRTWYGQQQRLSSSFKPNINGDARHETSQSEGSNVNTKVLKITRMVRDKNGILQRKFEIIKDPAVIKAYIKRRERIEEDIIPEEVKLTNDEEKNQKTKKLLEEQLAKLQKNQERRNARKASRENQGNKGVGKGKSTTRRCATCGAIGHIRTNKACPMYDEGNP